jgi:hypothetical protein
MQQDHENVPASRAQNLHELRASTEQGGTGSHCGDDNLQGGERAFAILRVSAANLRASSRARSIRSAGSGLEGYQWVDNFMWATFYILPHQNPDKCTCPASLSHLN